MKVLIVKASALGDVVHALPVLAWLHSADPRMEVHWLVEEAFAPLLENHPLIAGVHRVATRAWRREGTRRSLQGVRDTVLELRAQNFDVVLDLQGNSKSGLFTGLSGAPRRFGFDREAVREWPNLLATNRRVPLEEKDYHISARSLALARAAFPGGDSAPDAGPLPVAQEAQEIVGGKLCDLGLAGRSFAVLHPGTTWTTKEWRLDGWIGVAEGLARLNLPVLLSWAGEKELRVAEEIARSAAAECALWPPGSLIELAALLQAADLVVGPDTGPVHMAAAVGTPTVSLYRATEPRRNGPLGDRHRHVATVMDCAACLEKTCPRETECRAALSVDRVLAAARELCRNRKTGAPDLAMDQRR